MTTMYKKVYINIVDDPNIADKEVKALIRGGHDAGIDEVMEEGQKKYKVYWSTYIGTSDL